MANGAKFENGTPVRPDKETRLIGAILYGIAVSMLGFLAYQIWDLNARMARVEVAQAYRAQQEADRYERIETKVDRLERKIDTLVEKRKDD